MKLYVVTNIDLSDEYFTDKANALQEFDRCKSVADEVAQYSSYDGADILVTLAEVQVPVNKETVLNLLNGSGGYIDEATTLKEYRPEAANGR